MSAAPPARNLGYSLGGQSADFGPPFSFMGPAPVSQSSSPPAALKGRQAAVSRWCEPEIACASIWIEPRSSSFPMTSSPSGGWPWRPGAARGGYAYPPSQTPWQEIQRNLVGQLDSGAILRALREVSTDRTDPRAAERQSLACTVFGVSNERGALRMAAWRKPVSRTAPVWMRKGACGWPWVARASGPPSSPLPATV
jgi:hypothetical protein